MLVTMRLASSFLTSRLFEGTFFQSSYSDSNVLGGNYNKQVSQDELAGEFHRFTLLIAVTVLMPL